MCMIYIFTHLLFNSLQLIYNIIELGARLRQKFVELPKCRQPSTFISTTLPHYLRWLRTGENVNKIVLLKYSCHAKLKNIALWFKFVSLDAATKFSMGFPLVKKDVRSFIPFATRTIKLATIDVTLI